MDFIIRESLESDFHECEVLNRSAFWKEKRYEETGLGCDEHYLVHRLRQSKDYIKPLDLVAQVDGKLVGHILYTKAYVENKSGLKTEVLCFGPLAVLPEYQKRGVGEALMKYSFEIAKSMGYGAVIIFGHPTYYPRVGFKEALIYDITTEDGANFPAFMALELQSGFLTTVKGRFIPSSDFNVDQAQAKAYDKSFI